MTKNLVLAALVCASSAMMVAATADVIRLPVPWRSPSDP